MPDGTDQRDIGQFFAALSAIVYGDAEPQKVYQSIVDAAVQLVAGCERASIMLRRGKSYESVASTDAIAHRIDRIEVEVGEGPCLDAIEEEAYQHDADLTTDSSPWPAFRERILSETPVRSAIGYRLLVDGAKAGALNIFSDRPGGLTTESADQGAVLAAFASVALMALAARDDAESLRKGLQSNREIGKAVGLLMAAHKVSAEAAFDILRETSQELNVKLAAVAAEIVDGQELQFGD
jgi:transcriptional regulator with GAF, ATPase, and Fis domain